MSKRSNMIAMVRGLRDVQTAVFGERPRRHAIPAPIEPSAIKVEYFKGLQKIILHPMKEVTLRALLQPLPGIIEEADRERRDSVHVIKLDSSTSRLRGILDKLSEQFTENLSVAQLDALAARIGKRTSDFQRETLRRQLRAALGVDPLLSEPASLTARAEQFTAENVRLIKTVPSRFFGELEQRLIAGIRSGTRASDLTQEISDRYDVSETNAARIANDQVGKFFGELNKVRQTNLGITTYTWRTVGDNRVREDHDDREGEQFDWSDPPEDGHPGEAVNCRCWPEPDLSDIIEEMEA